MKLRPKVFFIVLIVLFPALLSCGKKGPPFLREKGVPLAVSELQAEWKNGGVALTGHVASPQGQKKDTSHIIGCRIYHAWYAPGQSPCESCPIDFPVHQDIREKVITKAGFSCLVPLQRKKGSYFFEVRLIGPNRAIGPPSNRAKLTLDD